MTKQQLDRLTSDAAELAEQEADETLANVESIEGVLRRPSQQRISTTEAPAPVQAPATHTAKAERLQRERSGVGNDQEEEEQMSPAEKRALDAEKRAAWRKARLRSLENVTTQFV